MAQPIQLILARQLAGYLNVPVFLVNPGGDLLFYNGPAEDILGKRFEETGAMPAEEWTTVFTPLDEAGERLPPEKLPLMVTLSRQRPAYKKFSIRGLDGELRRIEVASLPLSALDGTFLGGAAFFWERDD